MIINVRGSLLRVMVNLRRTAPGHQSKSLSKQRGFNPQRKDLLMTYLMFFFRRDLHLVRMSQSVAGQSNLCIVSQDEQIPGCPH